MKPVEEKARPVSEYFGSMVFDDKAMSAVLPAGTYRSLKRTIDEDVRLDPAVAEEVAKAMRDWAVSRGATHFTHWFQPLTGITAEKHDSFISPAPDGRVIMEFSGKELIQGEPDASSFPSGGLRSTFEARGYTTWDPTSRAFILGKTLYIPTAFCSYGGEALDKKTPLLRSMQALNKQALRILRLFGNDTVKCVRPSVGPEQEYFLVDKKLYEQRKDLIFTGRTLFGAKPPKGQEMDDHYFGTIPPRVSEFMADLNDELWKLGIPAKTEHNEVAPAQHELATVYSTTNIATDHNQLTMHVMRLVADCHGLVCLLHEKPFAGVNGSGKHNNWSLATDTGVNLLTPGEMPHDNIQFLVFLAAILKAVDDYQDLLRISVATAGNDHRLGANEAPPAVVSVFLGDELTGVVEAIANDLPYNGVEKVQLKLGSRVLPRFFRDTTDRNRTSPFAFTGNKFEFRMLGSSDSIACTNIMLNSSVAESLCAYADLLETAEDFEKAVADLIRGEFRAHQRIIFNGNGYESAWIEEATKVRGLLNYVSTPDCLPHLLDDKNTDMLIRHRVYSRTELESRTGALLENYCKTLLIEARTMVHMTHRQILPAVTKYGATLAESIGLKRAAFKDIACAHDVSLLKKLSALSDSIAEKLEALETAIETVEGESDTLAQSRIILDLLIPKMNDLRGLCDTAETLTAEEYWPFPTYEKLLFSVGL